MADIQQKPNAACSLVINVSRGDTPILEYTIPHILDSHAIQFTEVIIVVDEQPAEGRIGRQYHQYSLKELYNSLEKVRKKGHEFRCEVVSYQAQDVQKTYLEWFGHSNITYRCAGGTPIYAFLYGLGLARYDIRLHLDSDMLIYDPDPASWVSKAITTLEEVPEILFVNQTWGLQTSGVPAPESMPSADLGYGQRVSQVFSSRCFIFSMDKLRKAFLPIKPTKHPFTKRIIYRLQKRSPYMAFEQMVSRALNRTHTYRADLDSHWGFSLHAWDKSVFQDTNINDVLKHISTGQVPTEHLGQHNLNYSLFVKQREWIE